MVTFLDNAGSCMDIDLTYDVQLTGLNIAISLPYLTQLQNGIALENLSSWMFGNLQKQNTG